MLILHTSDFHIGRTLYDKPLLEDQKYILKQIIQELENPAGMEEGSKYDVLIIAGDIYDRSLPSQEAVELFSSFLEEIYTKLPELEIMIIPGNHDSSSRLAYLSRILKKLKIHIVSDIKDSITPVLVEKNGEKVQFFLLPYLYGKNFDFTFPRLEDTLFPPGQEQMVQTCINAITGKMDKKIPSVLAAHLYTLGGEQSQSERGTLGDTEFVARDFSKDFTYTALGHLHKTQKITGSCFYSGSPLQYSFDEAPEKNIIRVKIEPKTKKTEPEIQLVPLNPLRKLKKLQGKFSDFMTGNKFKTYKDQYLEITLEDRGIVENPMLLLKPRFPNLLSIRQKALEPEQDRQKNEKQTNTEYLKLSQEERILNDYEEFLRDIYQNESEEFFAEKEKEKNYLGKLLEELKNETG